LNLEPQTLNQEPGDKNQEKLVLSTEY